MAALAVLSGWWMDTGCAQIEASRDVAARGTFIASSYDSPREFVESAIGVDLSVLPSLGLVVLEDVRPADAGEEGRRRARPLGVVAPGYRQGLGRRLDDERIRLISRGVGTIRPVSVTPLSGPTCHASRC